jgi:hypothetical protein
MKKSASKKPDKKHEPALCPECLRVRDLETRMRQCLNEATDKLRYALACVDEHNYTPISYHASYVKAAVERVAEYAATLESERTNARNRPVLPVQAEQPTEQP